VSVCRTARVVVASDISQNSSDVNKATTPKTKAKAKTITFKAKAKARSQWPQAKA